MHLLIVESPAKAKTLGKYLNKNFHIVASRGHVRSLPSKANSVIPEQNFAMVYEKTKNSNKYLNEIISQAKYADQLYLATDPDREGEAIAWHIVELLKEQGALKHNPIVKRVTFNELTKNIIIAAIENPRDINLNLVQAQQARQALDYLVGFTLSPLLWKKMPGCKSAGRVQSVSLRLICEREQEIKKFTSQEYWTILFDLLTTKNEPFTAQLVELEGQKLDKFSIINREQGAEIVKKLQNCSFIVSSINKKQQKQNPSAPFNTSSLQQEASRKLGFSTKKTMQIAQKLYEGIEIDGETIGLITYMRTDGVILANEAVSSIRQLINSHFGTKYLADKPRIYQTKTKNAQEAHEAIRPTNINLLPEAINSKLNQDFSKLYDLIWKRTVACQMESATIDLVNVSISSTTKNAVLRANGSTVTFPGFRKLYSENSDDKTPEEIKSLPLLEIEDQVKVSDIIPKQHFTEPPPRYTEASLVKKMEELGIGRPSTYATIISVLQERKYIYLDKRRFFLEERGFLLTTFLLQFFNQYVEYDFTAHLENDLDNVAVGKLDWKQLLNNFWQGFYAKIQETEDKKVKEIIKTLEKVLEPYLFPTVEGGNKICLSCDTGTLELKFGRFGPFIACTNYPTCRFVKPLIAATNATEDTTNTHDSTIGTDISGNPIYLRKGPYGHYLQLGDAEGSNKPKRVSLPPIYNANNLTEEIAQNLFSLPKLIGIHPDKQEPILLNISKFGHYLACAGINVNVSKIDDPFNIDLAEATELINTKSPAAKKSRSVNLSKGNTNQVRVAKILDQQPAKTLKKNYNKIKATKAISKKTSVAKTKKTPRSNLDK